MFHPPPRQPLPTGAISHRHTAREEYNLSAVDAITLTEIPSPPPGTVSGLSPCTARPLGRGREEAAAAAGRWGWTQRLKHRHRRRERQGKGRSAPSPASPTSRRRYPIDTVPGESINQRVGGEPPRQDPVPVPRCMASGGQSPETARPLRKMGVVRRGWSYVLFSQGPEPGPVVVGLWG